MQVSVSEDCSNKKLINLSSELFDLKTQGSVKTNNMEGELDVFSTVLHDIHMQRGPTKCILFSSVSLFN